MAVTTRMTMMGEGGEMEMMETEATGGRKRRVRRKGVAATMITSSGDLIWYWVMLMST
jgi:hypothetical protein